VSSCPVMLRFGNKESRVGKFPCRTQIVSFGRRGTTQSVIVGRLIYCSTVEDSVRLSCFAMQWQWTSAPTIQPDCTPATAINVFCAAAPTTKQVRLSGCVSISPATAASNVFYCATAAARNQVRLSGSATPAASQVRQPDSFCSCPSAASAKI
jgi:hypothetical protein